MSESGRKRGQWKKDKGERGVYRRGKIWYIRYNDQNKKIRAERVGPSKALALKAYAKRKTEVAERRFFPGSNILFDDLIKDVTAEARLSQAVNKTGKKVRTYRYRIVGEWFKGRKAASITRDEINKKLSEHCKTAANFNRYRVALSHTFKIGIQNGKATDNPALLVKLKKENNVRVRFLEDEEEKALRDALRESFPEREPEFDLALYTGMRWSEQYELQWPQVDLKRNRITLLETKSGEKQYVLLNEAARKALVRLRAIGPTSASVCSNSDAWAHRQWWDAVRTKSKVSNFHWHDLRHTFASRLVMNGVDILTVNKLMRHGTLQVTMRYAHLSNAHLQRAVERLAGVSKSATAPKQNSETVPTAIQ
ncbi:MAG TPA: site-specific integrase [Candidatus Sulfotelmatobacter sp.]|nr:site-specific integrase [Candidatus Sulfotelmatobacter sp.]